MEEKFKTFQTEILTMIESGDIVVGSLGLSEESADFIQKFDVHKQDLISEMVERMKMEGEMGKLTPFQQTVNTYISNRGEEILKEL